MLINKIIYYIKNINLYIGDFLKTRFSHMYGTEEAKKDSIRNQDQIFLVQNIYPHIVKDSLIHDEYFKYEPHSIKLNHDRKLCDFAFIGESLDINDESRDAPFQRLPIKQRYN